MDLNLQALCVVQEATSEKPAGKKAKSEAARKGGLLGGPARAASVSAVRRVEIARKANRARWNKEITRVEARKGRERAEGGVRRDTMVAQISIRSLSNDVILETASAVKKFFELCRQAEVEYVVLPDPLNNEKVVEINDAIGRVGATQRLLIDALAIVPDEVVSTPEFSRVLSSLLNMVSMTDDAVADTYTGPEIVVKLLRMNLEVVEQQNSHLDNYIESLRISFDETCSATLANLATKVMAG